MINFFVIFIFFSFGWLSQRFFKLPQKLPYALNQFVINIVLPAVILLRIPQLQLSKQLLFPMISAWLTVAIAAFAVHLLAKKFSWSKTVTGALLMTAVLGNTSYLGFPMVKMFYGDALLPYAIIFDQLGNFIALAVYGTLIIALYSEQKTQISSISIIKRVVSFPPFIALMVALILPNSIISTQALPSLISLLLSWCALTMVPLTMFIVGLQFQLSLDFHYRKPLLLGLAIKMLFTPLVILIVAYIAPIENGIAKVSVFESAMPPMVTAGVMAMQANLAPKLANAMVSFGLFIAFLLLPLIYLLSNIVLV